MKLFISFLLCCIIFTSCYKENIYNEDALCVTQHRSVIHIANNFQYAAYLEYATSMDSLFYQATSIILKPYERKEFISFSDTNIFRLKMIDSATNSFIYTQPKMLITVPCQLYELVF
jgi:hypothetical protein